MEEVEFSQKCEMFLSRHIPDLDQCFIAGGLFPRLYHDLPIRDIDVYINSSTMFDAFVSDYKGVSEYQLTRDGEKFSKFLHKPTQIGIDLINFHKPKTPDYTKNFDFSICQGYYRNRIFQSFNPDTFRDIQAKKLRFTDRFMYCDSDNNILTRIKKYTDLGFEISSDDMNKIYHLLTGPNCKDVKLEHYTDSDRPTIWESIKDFFSSTSPPWL